MITKSIDQKQTPIYNPMVIPIAIQNRIKPQTLRILYLK